MCDKTEQIEKLRLEVKALKVSLAKCFSMFEQAGVIGWKYTDEMGYLVGCDRDSEGEWRAD